MKNITIPEKTYFKIGEVAKLLEIEPYVLRYWETEFDALKPEKTRTGQRSYRHTDIELLLTIEHLLYEEEYTISGARKRLKVLKKSGDEELPEKKVLRLQDRIEALEEEIAPLKADVAPLHKKIAALEKENKAVKAAYHELEKKRDAIAADLEATIAEKTQEQTSIAADSSAALSKMSEENEKLEQSLTESRRLVGRQATEISTLKNTLETLETALEESNGLMTAKVDATELEALEKRLSDALQKVDALETEKTELGRDSVQLSQTALRRMVNLRRELESLAQLAN